MVGEMDRARIPWMWWAYNEGLGESLAAPLDPADPTGSVAGTLVRPHARVLTGTPATQDYDLAGRILRTSYDTAPTAAPSRMASSRSSRWRPAPTRSATR